MTPRKVNLFMLFKLPAAFFCGVRLKEVTKDASKVCVKYGWRNTNPFRSMYFAVQSMAAELSTGVLVLQTIQRKKEKVSMLIVNHSGGFSKKAIGKITFTCKQGPLVEEVIEKAVTTGEGQTMLLESIGLDEQGDEVSRYTFEWSVKSKKS